MGIINVLDIEVANLIAAGEVVERPANAVKELVENSVDAGARTVSVEITGGGIRSLRVTDDGCGMSAEDAVVAVRRHATSKLRCADDLAAIMTLGFRGEALAAITAVAKFRLLTKRREDTVFNLYKRIILLSKRLPKQLVRIKFHIEHVFGDGIVFDHFKNTVFNGKGTVAF